MSVFKIEQDQVRAELEKRRYRYAVIGIIVLGGLSVLSQLRMDQTASCNAIINTVINWLLLAVFAFLGIRYRLKSVNKDILYAFFLFLIVFLFVDSLAFYHERLLFLLYGLAAVPVTLLVRKWRPGKYRSFFIAALSGVLLCGLSKIPVFFAGAEAFFRQWYIYGIAVILGYYLVNLLFIPVRSDTRADTPA